MSIKHWSKPNTVGFGCLTGSNPLLLMSKHSDWLSKEKHCRSLTRPLTHSLIVCTVQLKHSELRENAQNHFQPSQLLLPPLGSRAVMWMKVCSWNQTFYQQFSVLSPHFYASQWLPWELWQRVDTGWAWLWDVFSSLTIGYWVSS